tara:strand:+ start:1017 stop:1949 length:933 start_codon:yes stop_codon:yes gene_type:complete
MSKGVDILKRKAIWKLSFSIYCINPKDARTTDGKFGYVRDYTSPSEENYIQALNRGLYHAVKTAQEFILRNPDWSIARLSWSDRIYPCTDEGKILINDGIDISIDDYIPTPEDLKATYESEIIFESMDCCINCGRKEGPYSDAILVACKGCPELVCQHCNLQELGCKLCYKEDDLSFEADMTKEGKDYVSRKIATIMRDWKKTGRIGNSSPKDSKTAQRQAIAVAFSMASRKGFKGTKKAEEDYFYFDKITKKHGIISNKLLLGSLAVVLSIASIGNMMVKTAVKAKELRVEEQTDTGCGCGSKKKGGYN